MDKTAVRYLLEKRALSPETVHKALMKRHNVMDALSGLRPSGTPRQPLMPPEGTMLGDMGRFSNNIYEKTHNQAQNIKKIVQRKENIVPGSQKKMLKAIETGQLGLPMKTKFIQ